MCEPNRPNFFLLLDLDPEAPWNTIDLAQVLKEKRAEWSRQVNNPKYGLDAQRNLALVEKIQKTMSDPITREKEAQAAKSILKQKRERQRKEFEDSAQLMSAKGFVTPEEIQNLHKRYPALLSETEIRTYIIKTLGAQIHSIEASLPSEEEVLDPVTWKDIQKLLELLRLETLYDFLGMGEKTDTNALREQATKIYGETQRVANQTPELTSRSQLAGYAMRIFSDEENRSRYDNRLKRDNYEKLAQRAIDIASTSKILYPEQMEMLLEQARKEGLDVSTAETYLRDALNKRRIAVRLLNDTSHIQKRLRCPQCRTLAEPSAHHCSICGMPLKIKCPSCGKMMPTEYRTCTQCGFPIGNIFNVTKLIDSADELFQEKRYQDAKKVLQQAARQWSTPPRPLRHEDELTIRIKKLHKEIEEAQKEQQELFQALEKAVQEQCYYAASALLHELQAQPYLPKELEIKLEPIRKKVERVLQNVEEKLQCAQGLVDTKEKASLYLHILQQCPDCQAAQTALRRIPPHPPTDLVAKIQPHMHHIHIHLRWKKSPSEGVQYVVIRQYDIPPMSEHNGVQLEKTTSTNYVDENIEIGRVAYYAVFSERGGVLSSDAARLVSPVLVKVPVSNVIAEVSNRQVHLRWDVPPNAYNVNIVRSETHFPRTPLDGLRLTDHTRTEAIDRNVKNGQRYYYTFFALFRDHQGKPSVAPGVHLDVVPVSPPEPIQHLQVDLLRSKPGHQVRVSWPRPTKGTGAVLVSETALDDTHNPVSLEHLQTLGELHISPKDHGEAVLDLSNSQLVYLIPVVLFHGRGYLGKPTPYVSLLDVKNVRAQKLSREIHLQWDWPPECHHVRVAYDSSHYPTWETLYDIPVTRKLEVSKAEYKHRGFFSLPLMEIPQCYITVFAAAIHDEELIFSPGTEPTCRIKVSCIKNNVTIRYEIDRRRFSHDVVLRLSVEGEGTLPDLVLVRRQGRPPLSKKDGVIIAHISHTKASKKPFVLLKEQITPNSFGRLFLKDDTLYVGRGGYVRILHPSQDKMRLS